MAIYQMGEMEALFADIIWDNAPIASGKLAKLAEEKLGWAVTTTYTVLKRLCEKGIFKNEKRIVSACMTREEFSVGRSEKLVNEDFHGSLPAFVAAFASRRSLTPEEAEELHRLVDEMTEK